MARGAKDSPRGYAWIRAPGVSVVALHAKHGAGGQGGRAPVVMQVSLWRRREVGSKKRGGPSVRRRRQRPFPAQVEQSLRRELSSFSTRFDGYCFSRPPPA